MKRRAIHYAADVIVAVVSGYLIWALGGPIWAAFGFGYVIFTLDRLWSKLIP